MNDQQHNDFQQYVLRTLASDCAFDYDAIDALLPDRDSELFVAAAYHISLMTPILSEEQMRTISKLFAALAVSVLQFNVCEADAPQEMIDACDITITD